MGNVVNRVFDSSGPEGKVRGTPQQIIDKYNQLARDAQLSNDRVAAENFQQHAEHYLRMLAEAQREQAERQAQQQQQQQDRQQRNQNQGGGGSNQNSNTNEQPRAEAQQPDSGGQDQPQTKADDVIDMPSGDDNALVDTPESASPKPRTRRRRPSPEAESASDGDEQPSAAPDAAE